MITVKSIKTHQVVGSTCGLRKDGSRAVLFDDNRIEWYSPEEFTAKFTEV